MATLNFYSQFTASKAGKTGLSPTIDVWQVALSDGIKTQVVTGGGMTEIGRGVYRYAKTNADTTLYDYIAVAVTTDTTVDQKEIPSLWTREEADVVSVAPAETVINGISAKTAALPADPASNTQVNTRMAAADYAAPPSAAEITNAVWSAVTRTLSTYQDSAGVTTLLGRIASAINITNGRVDALASVDSATIADAVWNDPITGRATNTMGYVVSRLSGTRLTVGSLVDASGEMRAIYDDDYLAEDGRAMPLSAPPNISLTGALIKLEITAIPDTLFDGVVDSATTAHVDIPRSALSALANVSTNYRAYAILRQGASDEAHITLGYGILSVRKV